MDQTPFARLLRFGVFELDLQTRELRKQGFKIKLQEQPFRVLATLLEQPGEAVTREELQKRIWPADTFVDFDLSLNTAITRLRQALGDNADNPRFVETLPRRGYRFIAQVADAGVPQPKIATNSAAPVSEAHQPASDNVIAGDPPTSRTRRQWIGWLTGAALCILALLAGLNAGVWRSRLFRKPTPLHIQSIAVLPLENLTGDATQDYLVDGMTDALITSLAQIGALRVSSRTSVMLYKGVRKPLPEIARELNVDAVVEGTVVRSGDHVRVDAQLIHAATDRHLWAQTYDRNLSDIVTLQGEVARAIAIEIEIQLTPQEQARLAKAHPVNPQVYEAYLKGRYFWNKRTEVSLWKSVEFFEQAIQRDPNYAPAYASIAESYVTLGFYGGLAPREAFSRSRAAAMQALRLDKLLAEAHNALACTLFDYDWDWSGAEREFKRAIELNPNYGLAHLWYGLFLHAMGREDWAAESKRAHELNPLGPASGMGGMYIFSGQYDRAIEVSRQTLERDPSFAFTYLQLAQAYEAKGMYEKAVEATEQATILFGGSPYFRGILGYTYAIGGKKAEAMKTLGELSELSKRRYVSPYHIATVYVGLGDKDRAFEWLNKAYEERASPLVLLKIGERLERIRSDPRYAELERRIGLPP